MATVATTASSSSTPHVDVLNYSLKDAYRQGRQSTMQKVIELAKQIGINEANYLAWEDRYEDGIPISDLQCKKLVWGYDDEHRPFIAIQYKVDSGEYIERECSTLRQASSVNGDAVVQVGKKQFHIDLHDVIGLKYLDALFKGQTVSQTWSFYDKNFSRTEVIRKITLIDEEKTKALHLF